MKKLWAIIILPGIFMALVFILLGDAFEAALSPEKFLKEYGSSSWLWLTAIGLMVSDLLLPIPASGIMSAIASLYGIKLGFVINFFGIFLSGIIGYALAKFLGKKFSRFICNEEELSIYKSFFDNWGGSAIILSRLLPILPEVLSLTAGFSHMNFKKFLLSIFLGSAGASLLFSWIGASNKSNSQWGIIVSVVIPLILWGTFNKFMGNKESH